MVIYSHQTQTMTQTTSLFLSSPADEESRNYHVQLMAAGAQDDPQTRSTQLWWNWMNRRPRAANLKNKYQYKVNACHHKYNDRIRHREEEQGVQEVE